jgi:8-oxo-dGTP pyrophosphatase MutT (NUDIX family)
MYEGVEYEHLKKYVLTFAHFDIYAKNPICTLAVRKPKGTMHEGLINLPGGKIKEGERPSDAAIRELLEETGVQGSFPQYMGRITNGRTYDVMVYRCIAPSYGHPAGVHEAHGHEIHNVPIHQLLRSEETLPNVTLLLSLCAGGIFGWEIRDGYEDAEVQQDEFDEYSSMIFNKYYSGRVFFDRTKNHVPAI